MIFFQVKNSFHSHNGDETVLLTALQFFEMEPRKYVVF